MLCDKCKKRNAVAHFKENINGVKKELHLCSQCAAEMSYNNIFSEIENDFSSLLGSVLLGEMPISTLKNGYSGVKRCSVCGLSFDEILESGEAGCGNCYTDFRDEIMGSVARLHGKAAHIGKIPNNKSEKIYRKKKIAAKKEELSKAVESQNFELAAKLRDEINEIQGGSENE